jgi:P-type Cu+ transporter
MASEKITLTVKGMHCGSCAQRVQRALSKVKGVTEAKVDLAAEQAVVEVTPGSTTLGALRQAVRDIGFQAPE